MSLRMVLSLTPDLAHEAIGEDVHSTRDPSVVAIAGQRFPKSSNDDDMTMVGRASDRIDAAIEEMRDFLNVMHPTTDAEALHSLRLAFPTVPLTERIAAIRNRFFA